MRGGGKDGEQKEMEVVLLGDALEQLRTLEDESAYTCVTSPPYYNLRDYGAAKQIGAEATPEEYISRMVDVFREVRRVLRKDGTLWLNLGDSYFPHHGSRGNKRPAGDTLRGRENTYQPAAKISTNLPVGEKELIGIPWRVAFALQADGWCLRQDIIWNKTNAMPESVRDRCTKSHEYVFLLSKSKHYYFDAEAISEPIAESSMKRCMQNLDGQKGSERQPGKTNGPMKAALPRFGGKKYGDSETEETRTKSGKVYVPTMRRNKRDVWEISTGGFKGAHFAVFPEKLVEPCILAGCPEGGTVLDPFTGSGTTGAVAKRLWRNFVGVEINAKYCKMAQDRIASTSAMCEQLTI